MNGILHKVNILRTVMMFVAMVIVMIFVFLIFYYDMHAYRYLYIRHSQIDVL